MPRPEKQGLDYYPKDVDADRDDKLCMIIGEFGFKGEMLFDKLCGWIYKHKGYFIEWNEEEQLKFLSRYSYCGFSVSFINEVVPRFIKWGLFDKTVFDAFQILTSIRIQKTWSDASRKRSGRKILSEIWLIEVINGIKTEEIRLIPPENTQRKEKESKENKTKDRAKALVIAGDDSQRQLRNRYDEIVKSLEGKERLDIWNTIREFISTSKPAFLEPYMDLWNVFAVSQHLIKEQQRITDKRRKKFDTRIKEPAFDFIKILEKIQASKFAKGDNSTGWKVTIEFILDSEENYTKILEGKYD